MTQGSDFDWESLVEETIIQSIGAIAVYENQDGDIVIRQKGINYEAGSDAIVVVPVRYLEPLIARLAALMDERK